VKVRRPRRIYYLAAVIVLLATGFFIVRRAVVSAHAVTVSPVAATIVVNAASGATFAPAPTGASPALTAMQAWADYVSVAGGSASIPPGASIQLGLVTWPSGPADAPGAGSETISNGVAYVALNELHMVTVSLVHAAQILFRHLERVCHLQHRVQAARASTGFLSTQIPAKQIMETWQNVG